MIERAGWKAPDKEYLPERLSPERYMGPQPERPLPQHALARTQFFRPQGHELFLLQLLLASISLRVFESSGGAKTPTCGLEWLPSLGWSCTASGKSSPPE